MHAYGLERLLPLVRSVRRAQVQGLRSYLQEHAAYLQSMRIWPLVEKLFNVVYRNVCVPLCGLV